MACKCGSPGRRRSPAVVLKQTGRPSSSHAAARPPCADPGPVHWSAIYSAAARARRRAAKPPLQRRRLTAPSPRPPPPWRAWRARPPGARWSAPGAAWRTPQTPAGAAREERGQAGRAVSGRAKLTRAKRGRSKPPPPHPQLGPPTCAAGPRGAPVLAPLCLRPCCPHLHVAADLDRLQLGRLLGDGHHRALHLRRRRRRLLLGSLG